MQLNEKIRISNLRKGNLRHSETFAKFIQQSSI